MKTHFLILFIFTSSTSKAEQTASDAEVLSSPQPQPDNVAQGSTAWAAFYPGNRGCRKGFGGMREMGPPPMSPYPMNPGYPNPNFNGSNSMPPPPNFQMGNNRRYGYAGARMAFYPTPQNQNGTEQVQYGVYIGPRRRFNPYNFNQQPPQYYGSGNMSMQYPPQNWPPMQYNPYQGYQPPPPMFPPPMYYPQNYNSNATGGQQQPPQPYYGYPQYYPNYQQNQQNNGTQQQQPMQPLPMYPPPQYYGNGQRFYPYQYQYNNPSYPPQNMYNNSVMQQPQPQYGNPTLNNQGYAPGSQTAVNQQQQPINPNQSPSNGMRDNYPYLPSNVTRNYRVTPRVEVQTQPTQTQQS